MKLSHTIFTYKTHKKEYYIYLKKWRQMQQRGEIGYVQRPKKKIIENNCCALLCFFLLIKLILKQIRISMLKIWKKFQFT